MGLWAPSKRRKTRRYPREASASIDDAREWATGLQHAHPPACWSIPLCNARQTPWTAVCVPASSPPLSSRPGQQRVLRRVKEALAGHQGVQELLLWELLHVLALRELAERPGEARLLGLRHQGHVQVGRHLRRRLLGLGRRGPRGAGGALPRRGDGLRAAGHRLFGLGRGALLPLLLLRLLGRPLLLRGLLLLLGGGRLRVRLRLLRLRLLAGGGLLRLLCGLGLGVLHVRLLVLLASLVDLLVLVRQDAGPLHKRSLLLVGHRLPGLASSPRDLLEAGADRPLFRKAPRHLLPVLGQPDGVGSLRLLGAGPALEVLQGPSPGHLLLGRPAGLLL
mmetsp:Transcript_97381/g.218283  ORF Transcript_97381/g.218283 Transcript_97381/m.218283 type:complete len:335 (-) Transcript_97381:317-1321(-)